MIYYDIISVDTCVMIIGVSMGFLCFPYIICHPHFRWIWDSPIIPTRIGPAAFTSNRVRTSTRVKPSIRSLAPARATGPPHHQRSPSRFQWSRERAIPVRDPETDMWISLRETDLQFWVSESEMKTSEQNGSSNLMVWFFGSFDLYLQFTHRKCLLKKVSRVDFPSRRFFNLSKVAWVIRMKHRGRSRSLGDSWGATVVFTLRGSGRCPWF